jgi:hypothetical protein
MHTKTCLGFDGIYIQKTALAAFERINQFDRLTKKEFDKIVKQHNISIDDNQLIAMLIDYGWHFLPFEEADSPCYIKEIPEFGVKSITAETVIEMELQRMADEIDDTPSHLATEKSNATILILRDILSKIRWARKKGILKKL